MSQVDVDVGLDWSVLATAACHEVTANTKDTLCRDESALCIESQKSVPVTFNFS